MHPQFQTEGYAKVAQHSQNEVWAAMNEAIADLFHLPSGEDLDAFLLFLIADWPTLKGTKAEDNASYYLLDNVHHGLAGLSEELALEWGMSMNDLGDDADARTLGFAKALRLFPDSELILESLIEAGVDCDDYYHEDAFAMGATSSDPDRNIVLHVLQALSDYNYFYSEGDAKATLASLHKDLKYVKDDHPDLNADHLSQAMAIVEGSWQLPDKDAVSL